MLAILHLLAVSVANLLRRLRMRLQTTRLPHVHLAQTRLRAVELDRPTTAQVAHHDPVGVTFADRKLVDANHLRASRSVKDA
jgi:hypothetical protein